MRGSISEPLDCVWQKTICLGLAANGSCGGLWFFHKPFYAAFSWLTWLDYAAAKWKMRKKLLQSKLSSFAIARLGVEVDIKLQFWREQPKLPPSFWPKMCNFSPRYAAPSFKGHELEWWWVPLRYLICVDKNMYKQNFTSFGMWQQQGLWTFDLSYLLEAAEDKSQHSLITFLFTLHVKYIMVNICNTMWKI